MFQRRRGLESVHNGYLTRGQLLALLAHSHEWADVYLDEENLPEFQPVPSSPPAEMDDTRFSLNSSPHRHGGQRAPDDSDDTSTSSSNTSGSDHVGRRRCPPNSFHNEAARGRSAPPTSPEQRTEDRRAHAALQATETKARLLTKAPKARALVEDPKARRDQKAPALLREDKAPAHS